MTCLFGKLPNDSGGGVGNTTCVRGDRQADRQTERGTGGKWEEGRAQYAGLRVLQCVTSVHNGKGTAQLKVSLLCPFQET